MFMPMAPVVHILFQVPIHSVLYAPIEADDSSTLCAPRGRDWQSLTDACQQEGEEAGAIGSLRRFQKWKKLSSGHSGELTWHPRGRRSRVCWESRFEIILKICTRKASSCSMIAARCARRDHKMEASILRFGLQAQKRLAYVSQKSAFASGQGKGWYVSERKRWRGREGESEQASEASRGKRTSCNV